jgi:hypothetical protein
LTVQPLTASDAAHIEPSLAAYSFKPYRHYRAYSRKTQIAIMRAEVASAIELAPKLSVRAADHERQAIVVVTRPYLV